MRRHLVLRGYLHLVLLLVPLSARADRGELYTLLELTPGRGTFTSPLDGTSTASNHAVGAQLVAYYGLTHSLQLGATLGVAGGLNTPFRRATLRLEDGSRPIGDLFEDFFSAHLTAVFAYRLDTGHAFAPVTRIELGGSFSRYSRSEFFPDHTNLALPLPSHVEFVPTARLVTALEYRFADRWVASLGLGLRRNLGGRAPWQLSLPVSVGTLF